MKKILDFYDFLFARRMKKRAIAIVGRHWVEWVTLVGSQEGYIPSHEMYVADELEIILQRLEKL
ncbi:MAG TPA: hypothetical protein VIJ14_00910 [Rhabdochlamydiaceae bacterium]